MRVVNRSRLAHKWPQFLPWPYSLTFSWNTSVDCKRLAAETFATSLLTRRPSAADISCPEAKEKTQKAVKHKKAKFDKSPTPRVSMTSCVVGSSSFRYCVKGREKKNAAWLVCSVTTLAAREKQHAQDSHRTIFRSLDVNSVWPAASAFALASRLQLRVWCSLHHTGKVGRSNQRGAWAATGTNYSQPMKRLVQSHSTLFVGVKRKQIWWAPK